MNYKCQFRISSSENCGKDAEVGLKKNTEHYCRNHYQILYRQGKVGGNKGGTLSKKVDKIGETVDTVLKMVQALSSRMDSMESTYGDSQAKTTIRRRSKGRRDKEISGRPAEPVVQS